MMMDRAREEETSGLFRHDGSETRTVASSAIFDSGQIEGSVEGGFASFSFLAVFGFFAALVFSFVFAFLFLDLFEVGSSSYSSSGSSAVGEREGVDTLLQ